MSDERISNHAPGPASQFVSLSERQATTMLGAIVGDVIGSAYEGTGWKSKEFPLFPPSCCFTDDTVLTLATADALLNGRSYAEVYRDYGRRYPNAGYGASFLTWIFTEGTNPYGN